MGALQARFVVIRDDMRVHWYVNKTNVTPEVASFVRRGFMQINIRKDRIQVLFPGDVDWRDE
jgi:hypothetical protein